MVDITWTQPWTPLEAPSASLSLCAKLQWAQTAFSLANSLNMHQRRGLLGWHDQVINTLLLFFFFCSVLTLPIRTHLDDLLESSFPSSRKWNSQSSLFPPHTLFKKRSFWLFIYPLDCKTLTVKSCTRTSAYTAQWVCERVTIYRPKESFTAYARQRCKFQGGHLACV